MIKSVYFGSFNPTHTGHLKQMYHSVLLMGVPLDIILSPHNPHKDPNVLLPYGLRKDILQVSIEDDFSMIPRIKEMININEIEDTLPTPNYTYLTLRKLTELYGEKPDIILGTDVINNLHLWKNSEEVSQYGIIHCERPGYILDPKIRVDIVETFKSDIKVSSTDVRNSMMGDRKLAKEAMTERSFKLLNRYYELEKL